MPCCTFSLPGRPYQYVILILSPSTACSVLVECITKIAQGFLFSTFHCLKFRRLGQKHTAVFEVLSGPALINFKGRLGLHFLQNHFGVLFPLHPETRTSPDHCTLSAVFD